MEGFYTLYPEFNIFIYKKFNNNLLCNYSNDDIIKHYSKIKNKENLITSINDFYYKYPNFDLLFFKIINDNLLFENNIDYLVYYHNIENKEDYIINADSYIKKYNIDIIFLKLFYSKFSNKNDIDIIKTVNNNIYNYIISNDLFHKEYHNFDLRIYKKFNKNIIFNNDIKYKSYWYHNHKDSNNIVYSIDSIINYYHDFNIDLFKFLYNIENNYVNDQLLEDLVNNNCNIIYSLNTFLKNIDDFNFELFKRINYYAKNFDKNKIINFYLKNINKVNSIYSFKFFLIKYPSFNIHEFKIFNVKYKDDINIFNDFSNLKDKDNLVLSIKDFYNRFNKFNINIYKSLLKIKYNIEFENEDDYIYYWYNNHKNQYYDDYLTNFYNSYPDFNINIYKNFNNISTNNNIDIIFEFENKIKNNKNIIYSKSSFYSSYPDFNKDSYLSYNKLDNYSEDELIVHFHTIGLKEKLIYNENYNIKNNFSVKIYKNLNKDLEKLSEKELVVHYLKNTNKEDRIYSVESFYSKYPEYNFDIKSKKYNFNLFIDNINHHKISEEDKIIYFMNFGIYNYLKNKNKNKTIIGRDIVNNIYEVLIDLKNNHHKTRLEKGISLIIRAKNEELNIKECIESVVDLVDEIILVDNNSTDNTLSLMKFYESKYKNVKVYQYKINVSKVGVEHKNALASKNKNTLGTFYNWCLSKATKYNVFKWDADFICIRNNFIQLVNKYDLKNRSDKFAIWFTGKTLFEDNNKIYLNYNSFYNEYRIFSYKNNFEWYDGNTCEYTDPYINSCNNNLRYKYEHPLFYEIKRTSIDEFKERSSLIDSRDINDLNILNNLKDNNNYNGLFMLDNNIININKKIIIYTPSLTFGGGNQFIINIYTFYKSLGFSVLIVPQNYDNNNNDKKYNIILEEDIIDNNTFSITTIRNFNPDFIIFNSTLPFKNSEVQNISTFVKIFFVTHSDVAYANYFIELYHKYFYKIITVNNYTLTKLNKLLNINNDKFIKLINYVNIKNLEYENIITKKKKFGMISRFSEDKNMPMLLLSLINVFNKYPDYKCYLVGTHTKYYDDYLKDIIKNNNLKKNIVFEGYQNNVSKYYEMFDFIILPSVSEGTSYNIIEAMNYGLPILCSNVGGNHELIKNETNGLLFNYSFIKKFEEKTLYITNYNSQLSGIGYIINDENFSKKYINKNDFIKTEVIVPYNVLCNKNNCINCENCKIINYSIENFNNNMNNINNSIIKMIEMDDTKIKVISNNNKLFIKTFFNENIYMNQLLSLFK
jgi:glycosyltransferase involved in cell wall biosynthesis